MQGKTLASANRKIHWYTFVVLAATCLLLPLIADAQGLTGALVGTVKDEQGAILRGAFVRVTSASLIGGPATVSTNERGQCDSRFCFRGRTYSMSSSRVLCPTTKPIFTSVRVRPSRGRSS
jgi:hypothetical protein